MMVVQHRRLLVLGASALGTLAAWVFFASRPPMLAQVGMQVIDAPVPAHYQAAAFPTFSAWLVLLGMEAIGSGGFRRALPRAVTLGVTGLLAAVRLTGALPFSGHALFLAAAVVFDAIRAGRLRPLLLTLSMVGLGVTAYYKLAVWNDALWFLGSLGLGAGVGGAAAIAESRGASARRGRQRAAAGQGARL